MNSRTLPIQNIETVLRKYFSLYWLRPETALWRTMDWLAIKDLPWMGRSLSLCCGDGLNDYVLMGGSPPLEIDDCNSVRDVTPEDYFERGLDIYDSSIKYDFPEIHAPPFCFDIGIDGKAALVEKASRLKAHDELIVHDVETELPIVSETIDIVFSNSLYWMTNIKNVLREIRRILRADGQVVALLCLSNLEDHALFNIYQGHNYKWVKAIDRGRHKHVKQRCSLEEWIDLFDSAGLSVTTRKTFISRRMIGIDQIGLRPLAPILAKMANSLDVSKRRQIKEEWIEYLMYIGLPLVQSGFLTDSSEEQTFVCLTARK